MAVYDLTQTVPSSIAAGDVLNCPYSGNAIEIVLPKGTYKLECWGAQGGYRTNYTDAGMGGYAAGTLVSAVNGRKLILYAGGSGNTGGTAGGFNGGGKRATYNGGGGASDIRLDQDSLYARVIVAGGGGSDGATAKPGKYGGGTEGGSATENYGSVGYGGTQTGVSGGSSYITDTQSDTTTAESDTYAGFGFGGNGVLRSNGYGGAGGGGWYGGCGAYPDGSSDDDRGGGGGSGYIYTEDSAANYPEGCLLGSADYLTDASMTAGNASMTDPDGSAVTGHGGNGYVRITVIEAVISAPTVTIVSPEQGAFVTDALPSVVFTITDIAGSSKIDLAGLTVTLDGFDVDSAALTVTDITNGYRVTFTPNPALDSGVHTVAIEFVNTDGTGASAGVSFYVAREGLNLVTDRTQADVYRVRELAAKYPNWSESEAAEWNAGLKGAYNYTDLNRVGTVCAGLFALITGYGYDVPGYTPLSTEWTVANIPTRSDMAAYLSTVAALKAAFSTAGNVPADMDGLTYAEANEIERVLVLVYEAAQNIAASFVYSGQTYSGMVWSQFGG